MLSLQALITVLALACSGVSALPGHEIATRSPDRCSRGLYFCMFVEKGGNIVPTVAQCISDTHFTLVGPCGAKEDCREVGRQAYCVRN